MKKLSLSALFLVLLVLFCACNSSAPAAKEIQNSLSASGAFSDEENLITLDTKEITERFGFSTALLEDYSVRVSKNEDEVYQFGIFVLKNEEDSNTVIDAIKQYLKPVTLDETNNAAVSPDILLMQTDSCVIFAVTPERELAEEALISLGAKEIK